MSIPIFYGRATTFNYNFYNKNEQELLEEQLVINNQFYYEIPKEPLFEKLLTPSDVGKLNRLVIPKQHAERNFPMNGDRDNGIMLSFEDKVGKLWSFRYSYWGSSQSYVLTKGWSGYVKEKGLDAGDGVLFGRRLESLNKKLGDELAEMKSSFMKAVKELKSEKRAREITEQVCDELARNIDEDRIEVERLKSESVKLREEAEREREMLKFADKCREERVQMKLSDAKHRFEEKNSTISKLRKQLENFLGTKRDKNEQEDDREVENVINGTEDDLLSVELNTTSNKKDCKTKKLLDDEIKPRHSVSGQVSLRGTSLQRVVSGGIEKNVGN